MISSAIILLTRIIFGFAELVISLRILLKLFGASTAAPFTQWVYDVSGSLLAPFQGIFPSTRLEGGFLIEFSALFGLVIYALIAYLIEELVSYIGYRSTGYRKAIIES